jgi:hypothetical protein
MQDEIAFLNRIADAQSLRRGKPPTLQRQPERNWRRLAFGILDLPPFEALKIVRGLSTEAEELLPRIFSAIKAECRLANFSGNYGVSSYREKIWQGFRAAAAEKIQPDRFEQIVSETEIMLETGRLHEWKPDRVEIQASPEAIAGELAPLLAATPAPKQSAAASTAATASAAAAATAASAKRSANGRIVFIDQKTERARDGSGYGRAVGARLNGPVEAARRGAVAFGLRSVGTSGGAAPLGAPTDAPRDAQRIAHTGATRYDFRVRPIPAFAVSVPDADVMAARVAQGETLRMRVQMDNRSDVPAITHNVMGEVPGTDLAHEVVLIGAHLDSWDLGQGAVDDGAGVAIVSAAAGLMARASSRLRPRRTVRVVLFANEENGFDGAIAYGQAFAQVPHQMVAESDFGGGRIYRLSSRVQPAALPLVAQMAEVLKPLGVEPGDNQGNPGPDAAFLMRNHRWPGLALSQDGTRYFDVHHTERDTIDQVDPVDLQQNVAAWAATAWLAAQAPMSFSPVPLQR